MEGVSKRYGGVRALAGADLVVFAGRIHAILGENGAGKSTLIKILAGVVAPDSGRIVLDGAEVGFDSPAAANRAGIVCIFQELSLIPDLSVADNIAISNPPRRFGMIDRRAQRRLAEEALERPARRTSIRWRWSRTCRCRAARWWRSPRRWRASPASSSSTRRPRP
jgi:ribose transport system ATP-binding protein